MMMAPSLVDFIDDNGLPSLLAGSVGANGHPPLSHGLVGDSDCFPFSGSYEGADGYPPP